MSSKIVEEVTPDSMDGDTPLEKELNAFLTEQFIKSGGVPADECLREAREIITLVKSHLKDS